MWPIEVNFKLNYFSRVSWNPKVYGLKRKEMELDFRKCIRLKSKLWRNSCLPYFYILLKMVLYRTLSPIIICIENIQYIYVISIAIEKLLFDRYGNILFQSYISPNAFVIACMYRWIYLFPYREILMSCFLPNETDLRLSSSQ